jgi:hypothetical protein
MHRTYLDVRTAVIDSILSPIQRDIHHPPLIPAGEINNKGNDTTHALIRNMAVIIENTNNARYDDIGAL